MGGCVFARGRRRGGGAGVADDRGRLRGDNAACGGERTGRRAAILGYGDTHTLTAQASSGVELATAALAPAMRPTASLAAPSAFGPGIATASTISDRTGTAMTTPPANARVS